MGLSLRIKFYHNGSVVYILYWCNLTHNFSHIFRKPQKLCIKQTKIYSIFVFNRKCSKMQGVHTCVRFGRTQYSLRLYCVVARWNYSSIFVLINTTYNSKNNSNYFNCNLQLVRTQLLPFLGANTRIVGRQIYGKRGCHLKLWILSKKVIALSYMYCT